MPLPYLAEHPVDDRRPLAAATTALVLIGFQNDYFAADGALHDAAQDSSAAARVLESVVGLLDRLVDMDVLLVAAPMVFTPTYEGLADPVGVLATVKARRAFLEGSRGARLADPLAPFASRIREVPGRKGFSAFSGTALDALLAERGITDVLVAGAMTCACVDSTARAAHDRGFRVSVLRDCTMGRTPFEQDLFCNRIFPLYAEVMDSGQFLARLGQSAEAHA
jgi:nicotinamidase-related amidase